MLRADPSGKSRPRLAILGLALVGLPIVIVGLGGVGRSEFLRGVYHLARAVDHRLNQTELFPDPEAPMARGLSITHGVASGDVMDESAIIWARASRGAEMRVVYDTDPSFPEPTTGASVLVREDTDFTARVRLEGLAPDTRYFYRVWLVGTDQQGQPTASETAEGQFKTAPSPAVGRTVAFVFGGDLGGAGYCRRVDGGYAIFAAMARLSPDFFIAGGDMIYADDACPTRGPEGWTNLPGGFPDVDHPSVDWTNLDRVREVYRRHWRYNRGDLHFQTFLLTTPMYAQWDDHEVINDSGAAWSHWNAATQRWPGYSNVVAAGRDAFFAYSPVQRHPDEPNRIYRSFSWGGYLDLFLLDVRSYRSRNDLPDTLDNNKTMLGPDQLSWLKGGLRASGATWKVVSGSVPMSIPTGRALASLVGRDGWADGAATAGSSETGFERELLDLVRFLDDHAVNNVVFLGTDAHLAFAIRYEPDPNGDGRPLVFYELGAGPLSAGRARSAPPGLDPTFNPSLLYSEGGLFNFGYVRIQPGPDGVVHLLAEIRGEDGQPRPGSAINLVPR